MRTATGPAATTAPVIDRLGLPPRGAGLLLQAAAHVDPDTAFAAWSTLVRDAGDAAGVMRWASVGGERRLLPLLGQRAELLELPEVVVTTCRDATAEAWGLNERLFALVEAPLRALAAEMPVVVLKGAALVGDVYPAHRLRPVGDVDVLVPRRRAREAVRLLTALGWQDTDPRRPFRFTLLRSLNLAGELGGRLVGSIDVHWHGAWTALPEPRDRGPRPGTVEPLPDASPLAGLGLLRAVPPRLLVQLAVNGINPSGASPHWMADIALLLRARPDLAWDDVVAAADAHDARLVTRTALGRVRDLLGAGAGLPLATLTPAPVPGRRESRRIVAAAELHDLDGAPGARSALRRLRRYLIGLARPGRPLDVMRIGVAVIVASLRLRAAGRR